MTGSKKCWRGAPNNTLPANLDLRDCPGAFAG
jgi:hypothetical protein